MAFENINWGMIPAAKRADQQMLMQAIGQGIGAYERGQDRQLKQRQLDMQAQKAPNLKNQYEMEVTKAAMGMPYDKNLINAYEATKTGVPVYDPITKQMVMGGKPDALSALGIGLGDPNKVTQQTPQQDLQLDNSPEAIANAMGVSIDDLRAAQGDVSTYQPAITDKVPTREEFETYKAGGVLKGTPAGSLMEEEFKYDVAKEEAKSKIEENRKIKEQALEKRKNMPKSERRMIDFATKAMNTTSKIDEAIELVSPWSTGYGSLLSAIPATQAKDLEATLNTIQADAAFSTLQEMRENSKTGGALGSVSERELQLLGSAVTSLDQAQSAPQLIKNLQDFKTQRVESLKRVADAFEEDYGYRPKEIDEMIGGKVQAMQDRQTGAMSWEEYFK